MNNDTNHLFVRRLRLWGWGTTAAIVLMLAAFVIVSRRIGADVRAASEAAVREHGGDSVDALIQFVEDTDHGLGERNRAVWALGQIGDKRALPLLRKHCSGEPCDHESELCQRELAKALKLVEGGVNATALVWRTSRPAPVAR